MSIIPSFLGFRRGTDFDPFALEAWDPFPSLDSFPSLTHFSRDNQGLINARVDWKETSDSHVFKADLAGLSKDDVNVEVEDERVLCIRGEKKRESEENSDTWHRVERSMGKFVRKFRLPENAKIGEVNASMEKGVLIVTVPKQHAKETVVKSIPISGQI